MRRAQPEYAMHVTIVKYLRLKLAETVLFFHAPNGGVRNAREAGRLKAMGTLAGLPDIGIVDCGRITWLEIKAAKGSLSEAQRECHRALSLAHSDVAVVKTLEDVDAALSQWGIAVRPNVRVA